nr:hypothetical protein [Tanacetum cinerariifolium]
INFSRNLMGLDFSGFGEIVGEKTSYCPVGKSLRRACDQLGKGWQEKMLVELQYFKFGDGESWKIASWPLIASVYLWIMITAINFSRNLVGLDFSGFGEIVGEKTSYCPVGKSLRRACDQLGKGWREKNASGATEEVGEENPSDANKVDNMATGTSNDDTLHANDSPIVQSVIIQDKPRSYVGVTGVSKPKSSKSKANFRSLSSENLCEGANFSIPRNVVETVSTRFANTLYGYFLGKHIAFPVVEYYVFSKDGLSIIASQIESLTMGVSLTDEPGFTIETVSIEYE